MTTSTPSGATSFAARTSTVLEEPARKLPEIASIRTVDPSRYGCYPLTLKL